MLFLASNLSGPDFARYADLSLTQLNDWRKRGLANTLGRPHPSYDGRYVYSRSEAIQVEIAKRIHDDNQASWAMSLYIADVATGYIVGAAMPGEGYEIYRNDPIVLFFNLSEDEPPFMGTSKDGLADALGGRKSALIIKPERYAEDLSDKLKAGLASLRDENGSW